ncbi:MerR family transcriptional regulator [Cryptosporangium phraense]|uniref:MerR family transcriptional regulator n=1 Tax=Cryptosporangium phraense TaxID=2593070 RepID=A0A545AVH8_9ACTN|nr:MerR family transcriptional regulator [Cryptosporangium phraense]TQS45342.1 MerR family transcriptional regulator [Cryptosporangium phraense]
MAWSTRELADLAGTTVNTIRHYHRLGLLDEPERRSNGYKQYGVPHLVCLLRIRRLVELGVPLSDIGAARLLDGEVPPEVLRRVDAELAAEIERLRKARSDIAAVLRDGAPADAPSGFASVARRLPATDTSLLHLYSRLYDEDAMKDLRRIAESRSDPVNAEFDALPPDADEPTRQNIAERLGKIIAQDLIDYPWLTGPSGHLTQGESAAKSAFLDAVEALYNPAQRDVLTRANRLAHRLARATEPRGERSLGQRWSV